MNLSTVRIVLQLVFGLNALLAAPLALACGAEGGDNREVVDACDEAGASVHPPVGAAAATAHPVDLVSGNKYLRQLDARWPGGLSLVRHYNSRNTGKGALGTGWRHSFDTRLYFRRRGAQITVQIVQGDGRRIVFRSLVGAGSAPTVLQALPSLYGAVRHQPELSADRRWVWRWRDGSKLFFSARGLLTSIERSNGHRLELQYGGKAVRLLKVTNRHRQSLRFEYDEPSGRLRRVALPDQQVIHYEYDSTGVLMEVARDKKKQWAFEHADHLLGAITVVRDAINKITAQVRYGPQGRAVYSSLGNNAEAIELSYDLPTASFGIGQTHINAAVSPGQVSSWQWRYDPITQQRQLLAAAGPGCVACPPVGGKNLYDKQRRLIEQRDADGGGFAYRYDKLNRLSGISTLGSRDRPVSPDIQMHYQSDELDAPLTQIDRLSVATGKNHRLKFERDILGRIIRVTESGFEPDLSTLTRTQNRTQGDSLRWQIGRWQPLQRLWTFEYVPFGAAAGLPWQIDGPLPGPRDTVHYVYDQAGRPITRFGPYRRQVNWQYNLNGLLAKTVNDGVVKESRAYDAFNRVIDRESRGVRTQATFDAAGHRTQMTASNRPTVNLVRDGNGRMVALRDDQSRELTVASVLNALIGLKRAPPGTGKPALELISHARGIYERRKPATAEADLTVVDDFGRMVARYDSETGIERFVYDEADRPIARIDGRGNLRRFHYHDNGRLEKISNLAGDLLHRSWDVGTLQSESQRYQREEYQHDQAGRRTARSVRYNDPVTGQGFGKALNQAWAFDVEGRLSKRNVGAGYALQYNWSAHNELNAVTLIDSAGRQKVLADQLQWQPFAGGQRGLVSARLGNGLKVDWQFDPLMRPTTIQHRTKSNDRNAPPLVRYAYDPSGKIGSKSIGRSAISYQHDEQGRLVASTDNNNKTTRYTSKPRFLKTSSRQSAADAPSRTQWYQSPTGSQVSLDSSGRPRWALTRDKAAWRYVYNASGERIGRLNLIDPSQSRWYIYQNRRLLMETNVSGTPTRLYVRLDDRPLAVIDLTKTEPGIQWIHTDAIGLPVAVTDESAKLLWQGALNPWGSAPAGESSPPTHLRLPGQLYDTETGLHDNYRRTYDPTKRRYLGPDPLGLRASGDRYTYANHSPLDTTDPLGLYEVDMHYYATLVIALSAGMNYEEAILIANANQYVDNGIDTEPIITDENGNMNVIRTALLRQQVLRDWHFVLDADNPDNARVSNPSSRRLTVLEDWVNNAPDRNTQLFNLGVYTHPYLDTAAHRDENNVPYPPTRFGFAFGHVHDIHHPDYTFNHCQEFPIVVVDGNNPEQPPVNNVSWNNNESRTITIQTDLYQLYRRYAGREATVSWEELQVMLREFNAIHESQDPESPDDREAIGQKLRLLESFLRRHSISTGDETSQRIAFVSGIGRQTGAYDRESARIDWERYFAEPAAGN